MRRFFIWSAVSALIGLMLAAGCFWAYWSLYARFQPVVIGRNDAEIQQLLDEASWVSDGSGSRPLYVIAYRDSTAAQRFEEEQVPGLRASGVETRLIMFARADDREGVAQSSAAERSTVAELWLTRDWRLYQRWTATASRSWTAAGLPPSDGNLARAAVVEAGRRFNERLTALLKEAGVPISYPLVLWRDDRGVLKACGCGDSRSWAFVVDDLDASRAQGGPARTRASTREAEAHEDADDVTGEVTGEITGEDTGEDAAPREAALPYPDLPPVSARSGPMASEQARTPSPEAFQPVTPSPERRAVPPTPSRTSPQRQAEPSRPGPAPRSPRPAPVPSTQEDATFY